MLKVADDSLVVADFGQNFAAAEETAAGEEVETQPLCIRRSA